MAHPSNETIDALIARMKVITNSGKQLLKLIDDLQKIRLVNGVNPNIPTLEAQMSNGQRVKIWKAIRDYVNAL